jgi:hypothetical protein
MLKIIASIIGLMLANNRQGDFIEEEIHQELKIIK